MKRIVHYGLMSMVVFALQREGSFDRTLNVPGIVDLDVGTGSGSITIRQGSFGRVEIHGTVRSWDRDGQDLIRNIESNPPIEQSGQTIRIGRLSDRDGDRNVSISYEISVPVQSNVRAHTGSGSITLQNIKGDLTANTGSGSIHATGVSGGLQMHTGSGGIEVEGEQTGRWELQTGSGGVNIHLPGNAGFELNAHTGSGGVEVGYPMTIQGRIDESRHDVTGRVGNGQYPLSVRTGSGHIRIQ